MIGKILLLALFICEGYAVTETRLPDRSLTYIRHTHFGTSIGIATPFWDTMTDCYLTYPNRVRYEAFPVNRLPHANVFFMDSSDLFRSCQIGFRDVGPEFSGTYELMAIAVNTRENNRITITRQNFHLTVTESNFD